MKNSGIMVFKRGADSEMSIRCLFINDWYKIDSQLETKEMLLSEIRKNKPGTVFIDIDLFCWIDGIETVRIIRHEYNIPVEYIR